MMRKKTIFCLSWPNKTLKISDRLRNIVISDCAAFKFDFVAQFALLLHVFVEWLKHEKCFRRRRVICPQVCFFITGAQPKAGTGHKMQTVSVVFSTLHCYGYTADLRYIAGSLLLGVLAGSLKSYPPFWKARGIANCRNVRGLGRVSYID